MSELSELIVALSAIRRRNYFIMAGILVGFVVILVLLARVIVGLDRFRDYIGNPVP